MFKNLIRKYVDMSVGYGPSSRLMEPTVSYPANAVTSMLDDGGGVDYQHGVCLDIDMPCDLIPSRTPGHYHLYIDKALSWEKYEKLLLALAEAGIVEDGWVRSAQATKCTVLRVPPDDVEFARLKEQMELTGELFVDNNS